MKKIKIICSTAVLLSIVFTRNVEATTGKVTTDTLNLRSEASTSSSVVELLNMDDEVEIVSEEGNWYKVKHGSNEGYVSKDYIKADGTVTSNSGNATGTTTNQTSSNITNNTTDNATTDNTTNNNANNTTTSGENSKFKLEKDVTIKILPLINSNTLGTAKAGEEITVITIANNWQFIQTDSISGWIVVDENIGAKVENSENTEQETTKNEENNEETSKEENTSNSSNNDETIYSQSTTKYINTSSVNVRSKPSTDSSIVTTLIKNTDVTVLGESSDWYKVKYNSYEGYIYKEYLSDTKTEETNRSSANRESTTTVSNTSSSSKGLEIVEYAKQYLGCPYVYGAEGSQSFDCSGFTRYVYKNFGYSLSHSAQAQSTVGEYVSKENLQPGDLVFFLDYETMDEIGHCGIYIGDGNFIHASSGSGYCVKISTLLSGSYYNRYATARRLV